MSKPAALQLLNLYGKEEEDDNEDHSPINDPEPTPPQSLTEQPLQNANLGSLTIVDYDHDEDDDHMDDEEDGILNVGRAVITPVAPPQPPVSTPPQVQESGNDISNGSVSKPFRCDAFLPPVPQGECDANVLGKIKKFYEMKKEGKSINESLRQSKAFRNPDILEKLVVFVNINEIGSNYPTHLWNPSAYRPEDFYDAIAAEQRRMEERREQEKTTRTQVEFVSPTAARPSVSSSDPKKSTDKDSSKKKSKWDSMEPVSGKPAPTVISSAPTTSDAPANAYSEFVKQRKKRDGEGKSSESSKKNKHS